MKYIYKYVLISVLMLSLSACSDFLDETPDNRVIVNSKDNVRKLLTTAYPLSDFAVISEFSSDNVVDEGDKNPYTGPIIEEIAYWKDITVVQNYDTKALWEGCYKAIANANLALKSIEELKDEDLKAERAEALITRAFSHFILVNIFAKHYNPAPNNTDLGIVYMDKLETTLSPKYERETVAEIYRKIDKDIEESLPHISDAIYEQPKFHFTKKAAYAFAARFNLYYGKWQKTINYATKSLQSASLINWSTINGLSAVSFVRAKELMKDEGVFLLQPSKSSAGAFFEGRYYRSQTRIAHTNFVANTETLFGSMPWGSLNLDSYSAAPYISNKPTNQKVSFPKNPYEFEITDLVAQTGYARTVYNLFTSDEVLLMRAEAKIHLQMYNEALQDLNTWSKNFFKGKETTIDKINTFYNALPYSKAVQGGLTQKKKLNPVGFVIANAKQENMLHYLLQCRRISTLHEGLRWFDIKRYGIEVYRFKKDIDNRYKLKEKLPVGDKRRAIQIPYDVVSSGITANPR